MADGATLKILLVCPWTMRIGAVRASLREDGISAEITNADFDARLRVVLDRHQFVAAYYLATPGLPFYVTDSIVRQRAPRLRLVESADLEQVLAEIRQLARDRRS